MKLNEAAGSELHNGYKKIVDQAEKFIKKNKGELADANMLADVMQTHTQMVGILFDLKSR